MAAAVKHVKLRNGVYQYVRRVPMEVQRHAAHWDRYFQSRQLFRVSLKTKDQMQMHVAAMKVHADFERRIDDITGRKVVSMPQGFGMVAPAARALSQSYLDHLVKRYRAVTYQPFEKAFLKADTDPSHADEYKRMVYEFELFAPQIIEEREARAGEEGIDTPADIAAWLVEMDGIKAPAGSAEFGLIVGAIRAGISQGHRDIQALIEGNIAPRISVVGTIANTKSLILSEVMNKYLIHRELPPRTEIEVRSSVRIFGEVIGDKPLDEITRKDFQKFVEKISASVIGSPKSGSVVRPVSAATVKKRIALLRAIINYAIDREYFGGPNPASGIKIDAYVKRSDLSIMPKKRRFTVEEMNLIFQHPWFTGCSSSTDTHSPGAVRLQGQEYWVPVLAALSGCRASELGGLMISEVVLDGPTPHLYIRDNKFRRTKSGKSRKVPLLDCLFDLGFRRYVEKIASGGAERLFPDWHASKGKNTNRNDDKAWANGSVIRAFNRTVIPSMLKGRLLEGARQEVTFHSFRGAFKAMLGSSEYKINHNWINEIIGHAKDQLDNSYIGEVALEETYAAVHACRYKGLQLPMSPF